MNELKTERKRHRCQVNPSLYDTIENHDTYLVSVIITGKHISMIRVVVISASGPTFPPYIQTTTPRLPYTLGRDYRLSGLGYGLLLLFKVLTLQASVDRCGRSISHIVHSLVFGDQLGLGLCTILQSRRKQLSILDCNDET